MTEDNTDTHDDNETKQSGREGAGGTTVSNKVQLGKIMSLIKQLFPSTTTPKTYRERFKRIKKRDDAQDLKLYTPSISKICNYTGDSDSVSKAFQSHTKVNSGFMPYAGRKSKKSRPKLPADAPRELKQRLKVESMFHNNDEFHECFDNISIQKRDKGMLSEIENDNNSRYLYDHLLSIPNSKKQNDTILIIGDIGCGKSTFISNVAHRLIKLNAIAIDERPTNYVRKEPIFIDAEWLLDEAGYGSTDDIYNAILGCIISKIKDQCEVSGGTLSEVINAISGQRVILIFDNLDYIYHKFCNLLYDDDSFNEDTIMREYFPFLYKLISDFTRDEYSDCGISCIFVARSDTAGLISNGMGQKDNGDRLIEYIDILVTVNNVDSEAIERIIKKRFALSSSVITEGKDLLVENAKQYAGQAGLLHSLNRLSTHGLRHVISLYGELSWSVFDNKVFRRFFMDEVAVKLYLYLGGKTSYTQISEGVTNIFLINNEYRISHNHELSNGKKQYSDNLLMDHMHTYWLKYYILLSINSGNFTSSGVETVFSQCENKPYAYEAGIVKLVLLSLSEFEHGRLIKPNIELREKGRVHYKGHKCTDKGKYLIENNVFFSFLYLAVVIEDEWLEFPNPYFTMFSNDNNFNFLFDTNNDRYKSELHEMIIRKVPLVLTFIDILEVSHKYEKEKCKDVFPRKSKKSTFKEPDFEEIRRSLHDQIEELSTDFTDNEKTNLRTIINESKSKSRKIRKELEDFFKEVYYGGWCGWIRRTVSNA